MSSAGGTDLCRITVVGPSRRVDIALPGYVSFADLFPAVARYAGLDGPDAVGETGGWVLQRLGQEPFSPAMTPLQAGLRDGEMIYLRPHRSQLPQLAFDDVADVIATALHPGKTAELSFFAMAPVARMTPPRTSSDSSGRVTPTASSGPKNHTSRASSSIDALRKASAAGSCSKCV